jgi:hypothetical protein
MILLVSWWHVHFAGPAARVILDQLVARFFAGPATRAMLENCYSVE